MLRHSMIVLLALAPPAFAQAAGADVVARAAASEYLAAEQGVGLSIGVVRDGKFTSWHFGAIAKGGPAPTADTAYEIGSISKTITSLLLARAVVAGKASLLPGTR